MGDQTFDRLEQRIQMLLLELQTLRQRNQQLGDENASLRARIDEARTRLDRLLELQSADA
ncbi:MAG: cell division protein ZapB [Betaproteobacteria bacterium]|jgi:regulator of replication initiation timing|nr:cell division protein ZapB [Betaproteobacteria bacterium]NBR98372.1 cell division protein ZapB [Betaproteobacteria bacterium]NBS93455.1 cell division protein ZapB [Betaproteobacteria bacterium]NBT06586.1 cell division protein ZapB [Betaproteobacteria bacterium]NBU12552.1 cell division protein ZapB [Betaproteobacteria bacterium]